MGDQMNRPLVIRVLASGDPLNASGIGFDPASPQNEINLAITINVVGGDADIVHLSLIFQDDMLRPAWCLIPLNAVLADRNDIQFSVAVDVSLGDGIANGPDFWVDHLFDELGTSGKRRLRLCHRKLNQQNK